MSNCEHSEIDPVYVVFDVDGIVMKLNEITGDSWILNREDQNYQWILIQEKNT